MRITVRLNGNEEIALGKMIQNTGLSYTEIVKKSLFDKTPNRSLNKNILMELGDISTNINLANHAIRNNDLSLTKKYIDEIAKEVDLIWQSL